MRSHPPTLLTLTRRLVREHQLVARGETVLVAVSGGPDSMALLHVLARLAGELGCGVVAHGVDHGLRPEAAAELDRAEAFAASLGVPFGRSSVVLEPGGDLQARARRVRRAALERAAAEVGATSVATGHHADDRAETVLLRLLRGSGPRGLACLPPRAGAFIRPLLLARRADVEAHLERHRVPFSLDPSNGDRRFLRTRVRHELMPLLRELSPGVVGHLTGLADDLMAEGDGPPEGLRRAHRQALRSAARLGKKGVWLRLSGGREAFVEATTAETPSRKAPRWLRDGRPSRGGVANWPNSGHAWVRPLNSWPDCADRRLERTRPVKQSQKTLLLWVLLILMFVAIWQFVSPENSRTEPVAFSQFMSWVKSKPEEKHVEWVEIKDREYTFHVVDPVAKTKQTYKTLGPTGDSVAKDLIDHNVTVRYLKEESNSLWMTALVTLLPMVFLVLMFYFFMRQLQAGGGKAMSFGKSRARLLNESQNKVTFADVAGIDEAKDEVEEIIAFLKDPKKFQRLGGRIPKGVLAVGPPGTGKTLLARAIAGEAGVPFFSISGSDFVEMFVGVGASRVRDLFEQGKKHAPCIIFIDEIDAVGRHRGAGLGGGHDEREQTLNQLLVEMDGFESNEGVIIIAATNRPDVLDPAILRPGRFDRRITVPRPDVKGRTEILRVHTRKTPLSSDVELETIARGTPGFAGADLENLVNEAALLAARFDRDQVTMVDFEMAKDKVLMGTERRSMVISEHEKRTTACHEAGHALVAITLAPNADPVHKVTIIPRGPALGVTQQLPKEDRLSISRDYATARLAVLMGGRVAEQLVFNQTTTGAGNDIKQASALARRMVTEFGMSELIGPVAYGGDEEGNPFLGRDFSMGRRDYSEKVAIQIDEEMRGFILEAEQRAREILTDRRDVLMRLMDTLLERETLDAEEIQAIVDGRPLPQREKVVVPTWSDKERQSKEKRRTSSIFGPPKPVAG